MTSTVKRKSMALIMALLLCFSMFVSFGTTAQAAGERSEIYMVSFPRDAENNRDHWDRDNLQFMNPSWWPTGTSTIWSASGSGSMCALSTPRRT